MNRRLSIAVFSTLLAMWSAPAWSEESATAPETLLDAIKQGKPMTSFRLRYENLNQEGYQSLHLMPRSWILVRPSPCVA
ncbi:MAG TPA: hypothetical protein VIO87_01550 [Methylotenera sp.]|jgi:hypothetical protein